MGVRIAWTQEAIQVGKKGRWQRNLDDGKIGEKDWGNNAAKWEAFFFLPVFRSIPSHPPINPREQLYNYCFPPPPILFLVFCASSFLFILLYWARLNFWPLVLSSSSTHALHTMTPPPFFFPLHTCLSGFPCFPYHKLPRMGLSAFHPQ